MGNQSFQRAADAEPSNPTSHHSARLVYTGRYHLPPKMLEDDYDLQPDVLGRGASGKVYLARERATGKRCAVKSLQFKNVPEAVRQDVKREAEVFLGMDHPRIARLMDVYESENQLRLVMECMEGGELFDRVVDLGHFSEKDAADAVWQILLALNYIHSHGVVHRDVKPENCFFRTAGGDLLLGDFGISCALDERSFAKTCVGSPLYMSPEIVNQDKYSFATDVWSLGVMLYEATMLAPPFKGNNICQLAFRIVTSTPEPIDTTQYSQSLQQLLNRLLDKDHGTRISLQEALLEAPMEPAASSLARAHGLEWPPQARPSTSGSSHGSRAVQRLRGHVAGASASDGLSAADPEWGAEDEVTYGDDFEEASDSDASYEADFEQPSDDEAEDMSMPCPALDELSESQVRQRIRAELGEEALLAAERIGVISFLGGVGSAAKPLHAG